MTFPQWAIEIIHPLEKPDFRPAVDFYLSGIRPEDLACDWRPSSACAIHPYDELSGPVGFRADGGRIHQDGVGDRILRVSNNDEPCGLSRGCATKQHRRHHSDPPTHTVPLEFPSILGANR
jgi:hypothetical protein